MIAILHKPLIHQGKVQRHWVIVSKTMVIMNTNIVLLLNVRSPIH